MTDRSRIEGALAVAALLICAAFIASFAFGLRASGPAPDDPVSPAVTAPPRTAVGRVEVLNASGRTGLARAATDHLRTAGFDVVYFGNAPASAGDSSVVLDRTGNDVVARAAARSLGILRVRTARDSTLYLDATVIVGVDWRIEQQ